MSTTNQLCFGNRPNVDNVEECKFAGKKLGYAFKDTRKKEMFPVGCYYLLENNNIYFNSHSIGKSSSIAKQICKMEGKLISSQRSMINGKKYYHQRRKIVIDL